MKNMKSIFIAACISLFASFAHSTIIVGPDDGFTTGPQTFNAVLAEDVIDLEVIFGVSEALDTCCGDVTLSLSNFSNIFNDSFDVILNTNAQLDTSAFSNIFGDAGTVGDLISFTVTGLAGDTLSFDWDYFGNDFGFPDFAFVLAGDDYEVLAQTAINAVPVGNTTLMFGLSMLVLGGLRASRKD